MWSGGRSVPDRTVATAPMGLAGLPGPALTEALLGARRPPPA